MLETAPVEQQNIFEQDIKVISLISKTKRLYERA